MSETIAGLRRKIGSAGDLQSVVRSMKALAASSIGQYEQSVLALGDYYRTVELGLSACFRASSMTVLTEGQSPKTEAGGIGAVVFGSDQGLVGQFNDVIVDYAIQTLTSLPRKAAEVWAVGERVHARLADAGLKPIGLFTVPNSVQGITSLVGQIQIKSETHRAAVGNTRFYAFHNRPKSGALYEPVHQRLLPLDGQWQRDLAAIPWPTKLVPEVLYGVSTLRALIREYLFISLFRACAESLASENASRLAAMQRADKNIDELLETLQGTYHRLRQSSIDEELFDVVSGYEALEEPVSHGGTG